MRAAGAKRGAMTQIPKTVRWASVLVLLAGVGYGSVLLWPASAEDVRIDALESQDLDEIRAAAEFLAEAGSVEALEPLRGVQTRLVDKLMQDEKSDFRQFRRHDFDTVVRRISDRRQSLDAQRFWGALGAVNRAIFALDPQSAAAKQDESTDEEDAEVHTPDALERVSDSEPPRLNSAKPDSRE